MRLESLKAKDPLDQVSFFSSYTDNIDQMSAKQALDHYDNLIKKMGKDEAEIWIQDLTTGTIEEVRLEDHLSDCPTCKKLGYKLGSCHYPA